MPIPVNWTTSPRCVVIPEDVIVYLAAPFPAPMVVWSKYNASALYPDPEYVTSTKVTAPPETVTFAVAPLHVPVDEPFSSFTL